MEFLHNDRETFADAISLAAAQSGMVPDAVEKDYYVTMVLRGLSERQPHAVFKGGTSLSKCHGVIKRFSEDIDIAVDTSFSQGMKKKMKYALVDVVEELGLTIPNLEDTRSRRDYNRYIVEYDSVLPTETDSLQPAVLVEITYTTISFPNVILPVTNMIGTMMETESPELIEKYALEPFEMNVQGIDRTLVDKVFALCDYYLQKRVAKHARHMYDIHMVLPHVPQDEAFKELVSEVRKIRALSTICPSAKPWINVPVLLRTIIEEDAYKEDYNDRTLRLLEQRIDYDTVKETILRVADSGMF